MVRELLLRVRYMRGRRRDRPMAVSDNIRLAGSSGDSKLLVIRAARRGCFLDLSNGS